MEAAKDVREVPNASRADAETTATSFENAFNLLRFVMAQLYDNYKFLLDDPDIPSAQKEIFQRLQRQTASLTDVQGAL